MKLLLAAALAIVVTPMANAQPTTEPAAKATAKFTLDTPIETLMADPAAKAVVTTNLPDLPSHPMYDSFKGMSLNQLAPMSGGKLTGELLAKVGAQLAAVE